MTRYSLVVYGYDSGLNELLDSQYKAYDRRTKKMRVNNKEKAKNDALCRKWIKHSVLNGKHITKPIRIGYHFFVPNKKHDRSNTLSGFMKSFEDALQELKIITNDSYDLVLTPVFAFDVDRDNPRVEIVIEIQD